MLHLWKICNKNEARVEGAPNVKYSLVFPTLRVLNIRCVSAQPLCMAGMPPSPIYDARAIWMVGKSPWQHLDATFCSPDEMTRGEAGMQRVYGMLPSHGSVFCPAWGHGQCPRTWQGWKTHRVLLLLPPSFSLRDSYLASLWSGMQQWILAAPKSGSVFCKGSGTMG